MSGVIEVRYQNTDENANARITNVRTVTRGLAGAAGEPQVTVGAGVSINKFPDRKEIRVSIYLCSIIITERGEGISRTGETTSRMGGTRRVCRVSEAFIVRGICRGIKKR
jgi:hypothetical protein